MLLTRQRFLLGTAICAVLAAVILVLMPIEKTLGQVIKIVYLHGALSRAGMIGFIAAGFAGLVFLFTKRTPAARWTQYLLLSGWLFWVLHFLVSMPATRFTWGQWIAWGEPRVTMTLQLAAAGLVVLLIVWLLKDNYFTAFAALLMAVAVGFLASRTGVLRHPLDPIGSSPSSTFQLVYLLLLIPVIAAMFLLAAYLTSKGGLHEAR